MEVRRGEHADCGYRVATPCRASPYFSHAVSGYVIGSTACWKCVGGFRRVVESRRECRGWMVVHSAARACICASRLSILLSVREAWREEGFGVGRVLVPSMVVVVSTRMAHRNDWVIWGYWTK